jgi:Bifunctional DNA primase/polymerase, N-terminal
MLARNLHHLARQRKADAATDDVFDTWQPRYAARGIATFPVRFAVLASGKLDKRPMVQHWMKMGVRASTELTRKFANAQGIGIALGPCNGLAVVDADTKNENVVAAVLAYYGPSPLIARSPSGGHHVYYKHNIFMSSSSEPSIITLVNPDRIDAWHTAGLAPWS